MNERPDDSSRGATGASGTRRRVAPAAVRFQPPGAAAELPVPDPARPSPTTRTGDHRAEPSTGRGRAGRPGEQRGEDRGEERGEAARTIGYLIGYARVSTTEQDTRAQHDALTAAGCTRIFSDTASGALTERPQLGAALDFLRPGDTLVVVRLDRLGRSLRHLIETVEALEGRGVGFRSLRESIDTTTPGGRLIFHVFGALAEFERELIKERTVAGLAAARARGRTGGRPVAMSPAKERQARAMKAAGDSVTEIAAVLGVSRATVYRRLADLPR